MMILRASFLCSISEEIATLTPVSVGRVTGCRSDADRYVVVFEGERPLMRVDVYAGDEEARAFEEAIVWRGLLVVGFGHRVHAVALADRSIVTLGLGEYFGHLYATDDYLLVASAERLWRVEPDRSVAWRSEALAVDGIVVHDVGVDVIRGDGELDPPGGWRSFSLSVTDGTLLSHGE